MKQPMHISVAEEGESETRDKLIPITPKNVLFILEARMSLLSVRKMEMATLKVVYANGVVSIDYQSNVIAVDVRRSKLYELDFYRENRLNHGSKELELWHHYYGHLSVKILKVLIDNGVVDEMSAKPKKSGDEFVCRQTR